MRQLALLGLACAALGCSAGDEGAHCEGGGVAPIGEDEFVADCVEAAAAETICDGEPIPEEAQMRATCRAMWKAAEASECSGAIADTVHCVLEMPEDTVCTEVAEPCWLSWELCVGEYCAEHPGHPSCPGE
jgi:hypothetical protein